MELVSNLSESKSKFDNEGYAAVPGLFDQEEVNRSNADAGTT
jgi:hypothetical protein